MIMKEKFYKHLILFTAAALSLCSATAQVIQKTTEVDNVNRSFRVNWSAVSGTTSYRLEVSSNSTFTNNPPANTAVIAYTTSATSQVVSNTTSFPVNSNGTYWFRVRRSAPTSGTFSATKNVQLTNAPVALAATFQGPGTTTFNANWTSSTSRVLISVWTDNGILSGYQDLEVLGSSQTITGLQPGTNYYYSVKGSNGNLVTVPSNTIIATTKLLAPTISPATEISPTSFTANWSSVQNATSYEVEVSNNNFSSTPHLYTNNNVSSNSINISGLSGFGPYQLRVRAKNQNISSLYSIFTVSLRNPVLITDIFRHQSGDYRLKVEWATDQVPLYYRYDIATDQLFTPLSLVPGYVNIQTSGSSLGDLVDLSPGTKYFFRVRAETASGTTVNSNAPYGITRTASPNATPAINIAPSSFTAKWDLLGPNVVTYNLQVSTDNSFTSTSIISNTSLNNSTNSAVINGLSANTTYYYRVRSFVPVDSRGDGASSFSNIVTVKTLAAPPVLRDPSGVSSTSFTVNWDQVQGAVYTVEVAANNDFSPVLYTGYGPLNSSSLIFLNLSPCTVYYYRVRSEIAGIASDWSISPQVVTAPDATVATAATEVTSNSFKANWTNSYCVPISGYRLYVGTGPFDELVAYGGLTSETNRVVSTTATTFYYQVKVENTNGSLSPLSNRIKVELGNFAPQAMSATEITCYSFKATWAVENGATGYRLDVIRVSDGALIVTNLNVDNGTYGTVNGLSYTTVNGLSPGVLYSFVVRTVKEFGVSVNSNAVTFTTLNSNCPPPGGRINPNLSTAKSPEAPENEFSEFKVYPNPASGIISISIPNSLINSIEQLNIVSPSGQKSNLSFLKGENKVECDVSNLNAGFYIIQVPTKSKTYHLKLIKN